MSTRKLVNFSCRKSRLADWNRIGNVEHLGAFAVVFPGDTLDVRWKVDPLCREVAVALVAVSHLVKGQVVDVTAEVLAQVWAASVRDVRVEEDHVARLAKEFLPTTLSVPLRREFGFYGTIWGEKPVNIVEVLFLFIVRDRFLSRGG